MRSRITLNLALLVTLLVLGAVLYFEPGKRASDTATLLQLDDARLDKITLRNKETIVFEKKDGHWSLTAPFQAPVNQVRVRQLIDIAKAPIDSQYPVKPEDLPKFELAQPKATLELGGTSLAFGGSDPINLRRYVLKDGTLYLVNDDFYHHLMAAATDYVDKKLLPEEARVTAIEIPGLKAVLDKDGKWTREPAGDQPDLAELATLWSTARAIDVRQVTQPVQGDRVKIGLASGAAVEFVIIQREPDLILARPDLALQFELTGESARQLLNLSKPASAATGAPTTGDGDGSGREEGAPSGDGENGDPGPAAGDDDGDPGATAGDDDGGAADEKPAGEVTAPPSP